MIPHQIPTAPFPTTNSPLTISSLSGSESPIPEHHPMPIPEPAPNRITIRSQNNITKPKRHLSFTTHVTPTPTTFKQATIYEELKQAMKVEYDALKKNQAWELVPQDSMKNDVHCKWLYHIK